jgi:hypothetical protein
VPLVEIEPQPAFRETALCLLANNDATPQKSFGLREAMIHTR